MSVNSDPYVSFISFLERVIGRLSFEEVERLFSKALDENPIFASIRQKGAFGKNIIVLLGGRGCGKTLALRYIKHYLSKDKWDFMYVNGIELKGEDALKQIVEEVENKLKQDPGYKVVIAIDDAVEADEAAREYLKNSVISLINKYAGKVKLVLVAQSERVTTEGAATIQLLKTVLGEAPHAKMFFGENPSKVIEKNFKSSYVSRDPVALFRGATIVNLDAYWSSFRSLENIEELANVIIKIIDFYATNAGCNCNELVTEVEKYKHGLALVALSSLPKMADPIERIVVEYAGPIHQDLDNPISALNGLGIAELLFKFFSDEDVKKLVEKAEKLYNDLKSNEVVNIGAEDVKSVILNVCEILPYVDVVREGTVEALELQGKHGPKIDIIHIRRESRGEELVLVLHDLRTDKRGYITSSSLDKLRKLIKIGVPQESQARYLTVIVPSRKYMNAVYKCVPIKRIGRDILVLLTDALSDIDRSLIYLLYNRSSEFNKEILRMMHKIMIGTVLFNLRDPNGIPHLVYHLLPTIH